MNIFDHINKKVALTALAAFLLLAGGFIFFLATGGTEDRAAVTRIDASPLDATLGRELLATLARLRATTIDTGIFDDPVFASLTDFGVAIASQPIGRRNPFAPFEAPQKSAVKKPAAKAPASLGGRAGGGAAGAAASKPPPPPPPPAFAGEEEEEEEEPGEDTEDEEDGFSGFDVE